MIKKSWAPLISNRFSKRLLSTWRHMAARRTAFSGTRVNTLTTTFCHICLKSCRDIFDSPDRAARTCSFMCLFTWGKSKEFDPSTDVAVYECVQSAFLGRLTWLSTSTSSDIFDSPDRAARTWSFMCLFTWRKSQEFDPIRRLTWLSTSTASPPSWVDWRGCLKSTSIPPSWVDWRGCLRVRPVRLPGSTDVAVYEYVQSAFLGRLTWLSTSSPPSWVCSVEPLPDVSLIMCWSSVVLKTQPLPHS
jgi:hypothetical protein